MVRGIHRDLVSRIMENQVERKMEHDMETRVLNVRISDLWAKLTFEVLQLGIRGFRV